MGLVVFTKPNFILTALGMVNISLGIFLGFKILRMKDKPKEIITDFGIIFII